MKKRFISAALSAALLLGSVPAFAAEGMPTPVAVPTAEQLLQIIPAEIQQQARAGTLPEGQTASGSGFQLGLEQLEDGCCIIEAGQYIFKYGVFDFNTGDWRIPCIYDALYRIPEGRYFLVVNSEWDDTNAVTATTCYEAEADYTVNPEPLPITGVVWNVDEEGYVTLIREVTVKSSSPDYADQEKGYYIQEALLDNHYQMVLDYVIESHWPEDIEFVNGMAIIQSGSTEQEFAGHRQVKLVGSTSGLINRRGEWVGRHDYDAGSMFRDLEQGNGRVFAARGGESYWITEDGGEVAIGDYNEMVDRVSGWAGEAVTQARSRGLIPEKLQRYYTLDIYREEFCSMLMNLYRALGKETPSLDSAPTFTDCELADVRAAAALKVVSGYEDGSFRPRSRISREEAAAILSRFTALFQEVDETAASLYADDAEIGSWAKPQVYAMQNAGVMSGVSEGRFSPKGTYTIEQAISVINRMYDRLSA